MLAARPSSRSPTRGDRPGGRTCAAAVELAAGRVLGSVAFAPAAVVLPWFALLAFGWLALVGLVVPV